MRRRPVRDQEDERLFVVGTTDHDGVGGRAQQTARVGEQGIELRFVLLDVEQPLVQHFVGFFLLFQVRLQARGILLADLDLPLQFLLPPPE